MSENQKEDPSSEPVTPRVPASPTEADQSANGKRGGPFDDVPGLSPEILEALPQPVGERIRETFGLISGPVANPITKKVTSEHITQMIENDEKRSERNHSLKTSGRLFTFGYVVLAVVCFFGLAWMFGSTDKDLFKQIVGFFATFAAGFGAGWGFTVARKSGEGES